LPPGFLFFFLSFFFCFITSSLYFIIPLFCSDGLVSSSDSDCWSSLLSQPYKKDLYKPLQFIKPKIIYCVTSFYRLICYHRHASLKLGLQN
jgi:hypothetical protein